MCTVNLCGIYQVAQILTIGPNALFAVCVYEESTITIYMKKKKTVQRNSEVRDYSMRMRLPTMNIDEDEEHVLNAA